MQTGGLGAAFIIISRASVTESPGPLTLVDLDGLPELLGQAVRVLGRVIVGVPRQPRHHRAVHVAQLQ
jgi:hypothetical protein